VFFPPSLVETTSTPPLFSCSVFYLPLLFACSTPVYSSFFISVQPRLSSIFYLSPELPSMLFFLLFPSFFPSPQCPCFSIPYHTDLWPLIFPPFGISESHSPNVLVPFFFSSRNLFPPDLTLDLMIPLPQCELHMGSRPFCLGILFFQVRSSSDSPYCPLTPPTIVSPGPLCMSTIYNHSLPICRSELSNVSFKSP